MISAVKTMPQASTTMINRGLTFPWWREVVSIETAAEAWRSESAGRRIEPPTHTNFARDAGAMEKEETVEMMEKARFKRCWVPSRRT